MLTRAKLAMNLVCYYTLLIYTHPQGPISATNPTTLHTTTTAPRQETAPPPQKTTPAPASPAEQEVCRLGRVDAIDRFGSDTVMFYGKVFQLIFIRSILFFSF